MTVKELRRKLAGIPGNKEVVVLHRIVFANVLEYTDFLSGIDDVEIDDVVYLRVYDVFFGTEMNSLRKEGEE